MNKKNIPTLVRFGTVGAGNTLVDFVVFFLLTSLHVPYLAAQLFSYSAGVANSYIWNRTWTFQVKEKAHGAEIVRFIMINLALAGRYICPSVHFSKSRPVPFYQQDVRNSRRNGHQLYRKQALGVSRTRHRFIKKTRSE